MGLLDIFAPYKPATTGFGPNRPEQNGFTNWFNQNPYVTQGLGRTLASVGQGMVGHASDTAGMFSGVNDALAAQQGPLGELALQQKQYAQQQEDVKKTQQQQTQTIKWLQSKGFADLATAVQNGAMTGADAYKEALKIGSNKAQYSLSPVWGRDKDGNPVLAQMSDQGGLQVVQTPDGMTFSKDPIKIDAGDRTILLDPVTRQPIGEIPINNTNKAFDEGLGKNGADQFKQYQTDAQGAYSTLGQLSVMQKAMTDPNFYSGVGADAVMNAKKLIMAIGGDPNAVSSMETFNAASKKVILDGIGGSLGAQISDSDRNFIGATAPSLDNSPAGNKALISIATKLANRKIEVAQLASQYVQEHGTLDANWPMYLAQWAQANPLFTQADIPTGGAQQTSTGVPQGVDPAIWAVMTPEERALWQN